MLRVAIQSNGPGTVPNYDIMMSSVALLASRLLAGARALTMQALEREAGELTLRCLKGHEVRFGWSVELRVGKVADRVV